MIYLDYTANTPVDPRVLDAFCAVERRLVGNPNGRHAAGREAAQVLQHTGEQLGALLCAQPDELVYTSGATEANNLALKGIVQASRHVGRHIISTAMEHASVGAALSWLQQQGCEVDLVPFNRQGCIDVEALRRLLRPDTVLVAVSAVDSELGVVQPLAEIAAAVRTQPHCRLHVDATQAVGKTPLDFTIADTMSFAPHKFYGLNGCGLLRKRADVPLEPQLHGGTGSSAYRPGTPAVALAASMVPALELALGELQPRCARVALLNARLRAALAQYPKVHINSPEQAVPHILNLRVDGVRGAQFRQMLDERDVCVSVQSACSADGMPSRAVLALGYSRKDALNSWRISLSHLTTDAELDAFLQAFDACYRQAT